MCLDIILMLSVTLQTVEKPAVIQEDISKYILRGKVPSMVQLHACVQTETTVFLILQYARYKANFQFSVVWRDYFCIRVFFIS